VDEQPYRVKRLDEIPLIPPETPSDPEWRPVQHHLRLSAFGANVYVARAAGVVLVSRHDERASGQEELYFVVSGRVRFTLDGDEFDATEGTVVTAQPQVVREGVAMEPGSAVFAVGAAPAPGRRFESSWDASWFLEVPQAE
jgi:hypothetical protein